MNRKEHLQWCKQRALEYLDENDIKNALVSMFSDLGKHEETEKHAAIKMGMMLMAGGYLETSSDVRKFIDGCN